MVLGHIGAACLLAGGMITQEDAVNTNVRETIRRQYPHLIEHTDRIIEAGWSLAASRGWYGCEWYTIVCAIEGERKLTGVSMETYRKDVESMCGRTLDTKEFTDLFNAALTLGYEFGLVTEVVFTVLADAREKRGAYEKAAAIYAGDKHKKVRCFPMEGDELWYVDDLRPFGRIIERALATAFKEMNIEEVQAKRYISDRKEEKVIAYIPYKSPDFIRKVLDSVLHR